MNASSFTMIVPPFSTEPSSAFSAAGFIATRTSGWSPGVRMSVDANWIWNAETPWTVPAGPGSRPGSPASSRGRCRAPRVALVNRSPVSCMPSPESPANRMTTRCFSSTCLVIVAGRGPAASSFGSDRGDRCTSSVPRTEDRTGPAARLGGAERRPTIRSDEERRACARKGWVQGSGGVRDRVRGLGGGRRIRMGRVAPEEQVLEAIRTVFETGIDWIDTAEVYGRRPLRGSSWRGPSRGGVTRSRSSRRSPRNPTARSSGRLRCVRRARRACGGSGPTASTCTSSTGLTSAGPASRRRGAR